MSPLKGKFLAVARDVDLHALPGLSLDAIDAGAGQDLDAFVAEKILKPLADIVVLVILPVLSQCLFCLFDLWREAGNSRNRSLDAVPALRHKARVDFEIGRLRAGDRTIPAGRVRQDQALIIVDRAAALA